MTDIIQNFDRSVEGYAAYAAPQAALAAEMADWIAHEERSGYAIEFGAGTGLFTRRVQPWAGPYLATDAAPRMVAAGVQRCPVVAWKQHEAQLPQSLGMADWIFACNLLQWLENPEEILSGWRKILKADGRLVIAVLMTGTLGELLQVLPETRTLHWRSDREWAQILKQAGFAIERAQTWKHVEVYPSAMDFLRVIHTMGLAPWRSTGPGRLRTALKEYDLNFAVRGGVRSTWQVWLARAVVA